MLFNPLNTKSDDINTIQEFINEFDSDDVINTHEEIEEASTVSKYITSLVSNCYQKSNRSIYVVLEYEKENPQ